MESLSKWLELVFDTSRYTSLVDKERARTIYIICSGVIVLAALLLIGGVDAESSQPIRERLFTDPTLTVPFVFLMTLLAAGLVFTRTGHINAGALAVVLTWVLGFDAAVAFTGIYTAVTGIIVVTTILVSSVLLGVRGIVVGTILTIIAYLGGMAMRANVPRNPVTSAITELAITIPIMLVFVGFVYVLVRLVRLSQEDSALRAASQQIKLAEISSAITRRISSRMTLDLVLDEAVKQIIVNYPDVYHAQIFLVDQTDAVAQLRASTGDVGQQLLAQGHSLQVGSQSVIGQVTGTGQSTVARASGSETVHRPNALLPETAAEAAFPLQIGDTIMGALDIQSRSSNAFSNADIPVFQTLADQLAVTIDNARLFEQTEARLHDNERLAQEAQAALEEVERLNRQLTQQAWTAYIQTREDNLALTLDLKTGAVDRQQDWTPGLQAAISGDEIVERRDDKGRVLVVPLHVRGEVVGAVEFDLDDEGHLTSEDHQLIQQIGERFGLAAEAARLYEESQHLAQRSALINDIGSRLQTTTSVENTLSEAARGLKQALNAGRVSIRLGEPPAVRNGQSNGQKDG